MRIGLTDAERAVFVPEGRAVETDGLKRFTTKHMNLTRSLADVYDIRVSHTDRWGVPHYVWIRRSTGRPD